MLNIDYKILNRLTGHPVELLQHIKIIIWLYSAHRICSEEGVMLKTSAFNLPLVINSVDKSKFLYFTSPPMQHHSFYRNLPLYSFIVPIVLILAGCSTWSLSRWSRALEWVIQIQTSCYRRLSGSRGVLFVAAVIISLNTMEFPCANTSWMQPLYQNTCRVVARFSHWDVPCEDSLANLCYTWLCNKHCAN